MPSSPEWVRETRFAQSRLRYLATVEVGYWLSSEEHGARQLVQNARLMEGRFFLGVGTAQFVDR